MISENKNYLNCVHCGKCLPVCPSYNIGFNEFLSPRGRVRLILADYENGNSLKNDKILESMSSCLLCGRCEKICPNDVNVTELVVSEKIKLKAFDRKKISSDKLALNILKDKRKIILKTVLKIANIPFFKKISGRNAPLPIGKSFIGGRDIIFNADINKILKSDKSNIKDSKNFLKVGYFSGCVFNVIYPQISIDTVASLTENGVEVLVPKAQGCCGLPFISSSDLKSFKELAINNALSFKGKKIDYIITSCASCSYAINNLYPKYFNKNDENYVEVMDFSKKLIGIWSFFYELKKHGIDIKKGKLYHEKEAVFHIPCHLSNMPDFKPASSYEKFIGEPGLIADKIDGLKLKPLKYNYCCGNGGMFNIRHYDLSKKISKRKFEEIQEAAPQEILTSCSGCMFSLKDQNGIFKYDKTVPVSHLISIYARSLQYAK